MDTLCAFCRAVITFLTIMYINIGARIPESVQWHYWVQLPAEAEARGFPLLCDIQKGCWHHPAFYSVSAWGFFPAVEWSLCEANHTPTYTIMYTPLNTFIVWTRQLQLLTLRLTYCFKNGSIQIFLFYCFSTLWCDSVSVEHTLKNIKWMQNSKQRVIHKDTTCETKAQMEWIQRDFRAITH
jgi:hypothetical protein